VGRRRDMKAKTILSLSSMMLIFGLLSLHAPFLGPSALAGEAGRSKFRPPSVKKEISCEPVISQEALLELVEPYLGTPYRWGGASRKGMDCSGFVKHIYSTTFSLDLPHSSYQQHAHPIMKKVSKDQLQTGDLVFFSQKNRRIAHVGIYLADGNFIHAGRRTGVTISSLDSSYWKIRMVSAKRPAGLWRSEDADPARSFSQIEIALNGSGGALNGPASHTRGFSSPGEGLRSSSWQDIFSAGRRAEGLTHTFELQLNHSFGEASWRAIISPHLAPHLLMQTASIPWTGIARGSGWPATSVPSTGCALRLHFPMWELSTTGRDPPVGGQDWAWQSRSDHCLGDGLFQQIFNTGMKAISSAAVSMTLTVGKAKICLSCSGMTFPAI